MRIWDIHPGPAILPLVDNSPKTNEKCNHCGICKKVRPVNNISIIDHKPYNTIDARTAWLALITVLKRQLKQIW